MHCVYVTLIGLAHYKIAIQQSLVAYHGISHLLLVFSWCTCTHSPKSLSVYQEDTSASWDLPGIPLESVA